MSADDSVLIISLSSELPKVIFFFSLAVAFRFA